MEGNQTVGQILPDDGCLHHAACPTCGESFNNVFSLNKHVVEKHFFSCKMCWDIFQNESLLGDHLASVHNIHDPKFSSRLVKFWSKQKDNHLQGMPYACPVCGSEDFASLAAMEEHMLRCHREEGAIERTDVATLPPLVHDVSVCCGPKDTTTVYRRFGLEDYPPSDETQTQASCPIKPYSGHKQKCKVKNDHSVELTKSKNVGEVVEGKQTAKRAGRQKALPRKAESGQNKKYACSDVIVDTQLVLQKTEKTLQQSKGIDNDPFMRCFLKEVDVNQEAVERSEENPDPEQQLEEANLAGKAPGIVSCLNNGNLLYVYPMVEYRTAYTEETPSKEGTDGQKLVHGYLEPEAQGQKIEVFYQQQVLRETSSSAGNRDIMGTETSLSSDGTFPTSKILILSPEDRGVVEANLARDAVGSVLAVAPVDRCNGSGRSFDDYDRCILCKEVFPDKTGLQEHMVCVHINEYDNRCGICDRTFDTVFKARSHVMMEHIDVQCKCCQREFTKSTSLRKHMIKHSVGKLKSTAKRCEVCLKSFRTATALAGHVENAHPSLLKHQCDLCDKTFLTEEELFIHVDKDPHVCLLCSMYFESTLNLREHLIGHASDLQVLQLFTSAEGSGS